ncbi:complement regulator-acquiring protein (plasmid) [Borreliella yangtzensis]
MAEIIVVQHDFLDIFNINSKYQISSGKKTLMNRIIYLSLNYEIQKIKILKEMLKKLNKNPLKKFSTQSFLHQMVLDIQFQLDKHLKKYKMNYEC